MALPGPKVLIYKVHGGRIEDRKEVLKVREALKLVLNLTENLVVVVLIAEAKPTKRDNPPLCALVKGISQANADDLVKRVRNKLA